MDNLNKVSIEVITATNLTEKYLSCVPGFIEFWSEIAKNSNYEIRIKIVVIAKSLPDSLKPFQKYCEIYDSQLPSAFVAQNIRCPISAFSICDLVLTTDIDMFPLNIRPFARAISQSNTFDDFIIVRDVLDPGQYPICYNIASPKTWGEAFEIKAKSELNRLLQEIYANSLNSDGYDSSHGGRGWFTDQENLYKRVEELSKKGFVITKLTDKKTGHRRLDRSYHRGIFAWLALPLVALGFFSDYHVHHPINKNKEYVNLVLQALKLSSAAKKLLHRLS